jgi:hypothetical protein
VAQQFLAVLLGFSFLSAVIPTGMADLLFRSRRHTTSTRAQPGAAPFGFKGAGFRFNFNLALHDKHVVVLKPSDKDG